MSPEWNVTKNLANYFCSMSFCAEERKVVVTKWKCGLKGPQAYISGKWHGPNVFDEPLDETGVGLVCIFGPRKWGAVFAEAQWCQGARCQVVKRARLRTSHRERPLRN